MRVTEGLSAERGEARTIDAVDTERLRIVVIDDHLTFAELLTSALDREPDLLSAGQAHTGAEGIALAREQEPDVVLMDVELPDMDGFAATESILRDRPETRVVMLTAHAAPEFVARAAAAGACGFLPKDGSLQEMLRTLRSARQGSLAIHPALLTRLAAPRPREPEPPERPAPLPGLTQRERDVLELMGQGRDVRTIARQLGISTSTCRGYVKSLLMKLGAHTQLEAVVLAVQHGLLKLDRA